MTNETIRVGVIGAEGTLKLDLAAGRLLGGQRGDEDLAEIEVPAAKRGAWRVEEEFVNAIRGLEEVKLTSFAEGVRYMEFTEAVNRSLTSGATVRVTD